MIPQTVRKSALACLVAFAAATGPALAQAPDEVPADDATTYDAAFFHQFGPRTALDMVRQVPGFAIETGNGRRGLGQAGANILVDGERIPGKPEDALEALSRIPASEIVRIEILDGTGTGISGLVGQVANIVRSRRGIAGNFAYEASARTDNAPLQFGKASLSLSGGSELLSWSLALDHDQRRWALAGRELVFDADGNLLDSRLDQQFFIGDQPTLSASLSRTGAGGDLLNLNAELRFLWFEFSENSRRFANGFTQIAPDRIRDLVRKEGRTRVKLGGDYAFDIGKGRMKLIGLHTIDDTFRAPSVVTRRADGSLIEGTDFRGDPIARETVARAEYDWTAGRATWQFAAEAALNSLDVENTLTIRNPNGEPIEVAFPDSRVKEERAEAILNLARPLGDSLSLQASAGAEFSRIGQSGAAELTRSFIRPKGSVALAWRASRQLDISAGLSRRVGQLDFLDFIASVDPNNGDDVSSNPDIRPPQSWLFDAKATRRLSDNGSTTLRAYSEWISDIIDQVPIGRSGEAPGNLESGRRYGIEWSATVPGEPIGIRGAKLDVSLALERSRVRDPLTGLPRAITRNRQRRLRLDFRQDIPDSDIGWGASWQSDRDAATVRLDSIFRETRSPGQAEFFIEHKDVMGLTVQAAVLNLLDDTRSGTRFQYAGRRTDPLAFVEHRTLGEGLTFRIRVRGSL